VLWGLKFRVAVGAFLSFVDVGSDLWMIWKYKEMEMALEEGKEEEVGTGMGMGPGMGPSFFLWATVSSITLSMTLQLIVVITQNRKQPAVLVREIIIVLLGVKPMSDAWRVTQNMENIEGAPMGVMGEAVVTKSIEVRGWRGKRGGAKRRVKKGERRARSEATS